MNSDTKSRQATGVQVASPASASPVDVVREFSSIWAAGDIDSVLLIAEHAVYALYISGDLLPFGGETVGRDNITAVAAPNPPGIRVPAVPPARPKPNGDEVRFQVEFMYRHLRSGEVLERTLPHDHARRGRLDRARGRVS